MTILCQTFTSLGRITHHLPGCRSITTTSILNAQPLRKKKRIDPATLKLRVERKMKKAEKEISRIEREPRQLIPILEYQYTNQELRDLQARPGRSLEEFGLSESIVHASQRLWSHYRQVQSRMEWQSIVKVERAQTRALDTLKQLDENLYMRTVNVVDNTTIPYISSHMRRETAPNPNYTPPDGNVKDISKDWVM